jgi:PAS domain S-box-containing protein
LKQLNKYLHSTTDHLDSALSHTRVTVANQDLDLRYTSILNPVSGYGDEVIGKTMSEVHGPEQAARLEPLRRKVIKTGKMHHEMVKVKLEGKAELQYFDTSIHPMLDSDGKVIGVSTVAVDVSDLMEARQSLREANERLLKVLDKAL